MTTQAMPRTRAAVALAVVAATVATPHAQSPAGTTDSTVARRPSAPPPSLTISIGSAYEEGSERHAFAADRPDAQLSVAAAFDRRGRRHRFAFSGVSAARYVPGLDTIRQPAHTTHMLWSARLGQRTEFQTEQRFRYAPLDVLPVDGLAAASRDQLSPGSPLSPSALLDGRVLMLDGTARITRIIDQRSSLRLSLTAASSRIDGTGDSSTRTVNGQFTRRLRADTLFRAGYGFGVISLPGTENPHLQRHDVDLGVDYAAPLEFSRRTTFAAGAGTTVLSEDGAQRLRLMPYGSVSHALSKFWSARVVYERPVQVLAGFAAPLLSDSLGLGITGQIGPRWDFTLASAYSRGDVESSQQSREFTARTFTARIRRRIGTALHFEANAFESRYDFANETSLPSGVPAAFTRRGISFGLAWSTPLDWN